MRQLGERNMEEVVSLPIDLFRHHIERDPPACLAEYHAQHPAKVIPHRIVGHLPFFGEDAVHDDVVELAELLRLLQHIEAGVFVVRILAAREFAEGRRGIEAGVSNA